MAKFPFGEGKRTAKELIEPEFRVRGVSLLSLGGARSGLRQKTSSTLKDLLPAADTTLMCHASAIVATAAPRPTPEYSLMLLDIYNSAWLSSVSEHKR
eukprot:3215273-Rhodomonas_salina.3